MFKKSEEIIFTSSNIFVNMVSTSKEEAIKLAGQKLIEAGFVKEEYIESMLNRESMLNTYMNNGIAIPHGDRESQDLIIKSGFVILQFKNAINFGEDKSAHILIATAGKGNTHLKILAGIAYFAKDLSIVDKIVTSNSETEIYALLSQYFDN